MSSSSPSSSSLRHVSIFEHLAIWLELLLIDFPLSLFMWVVALLPVPFGIFATLITYSYLYLFERDSLPNTPKKNSENQNPKPSSSSSSPSSSPPPFPRGSLSNPYELLISGTGISGLTLTLQCLSSSTLSFSSYPTDDFPLLLLERSSHVGGTWRDNVYPDCRCDISSFLYSLSYESNPSWSSFFPKQEEIYKYILSLYHKYNLYPYIKFNQFVIGAKWRNDLSLWEVYTMESKFYDQYAEVKNVDEEMEKMVREGEWEREGDEHKNNSDTNNNNKKFKITSYFTKVFVNAAGALSDSRFPSDITITKPSSSSSSSSSSPPSSSPSSPIIFHSARWDHSVSLEGKTVAVIGTGASAIQFIPQIQKKVKKLIIFQRSAPYLIHRYDFPIPSLFSHLLAYCPNIQKIIRMIMYWMREPTYGVFEKPNFLLTLNEYLAKRRIRRHVIYRKDREEIIRQLTPNYRLGCKRVLLSNNYYRSLDQSNVEIRGEKVEKIDGNKIYLHNAPRHPIDNVDIVIFATGFQVQRADLSSSTSFFHRVHGDAHLSLHSHFSSSFTSYKGNMTSNFPNLMLLPGPNVGLGHQSQIYLLESQAHYIVKILEGMKTNHITQLRVKEEKQREWNEKNQKRLDKSVWNVGGCSSWYLDKNGKNTVVYGGFTYEYWWETRKFDQQNYLCVYSSIPKEEKKIQ